MANGHTDEQYALNRAWIESKLGLYPHVCWLLANPEKCWQQYSWCRYCCTLTGPGYETYAFYDITLRDTYIHKYGMVAGLPPPMLDRKQGTPISARAGGPQKVDYSSITRQIVGR